MCRIFKSSLSRSFSRAYQLLLDSPDKHASLAEYNWGLSGVALGTESTLRSEVVWGDMKEKVTERFEKKTLELECTMRMGTTCL